MPSPRFKTNGNPVGEPAQIAAHTSFSATLDDIDGVNTVEWSIAHTDDESVPGNYTLVPSGSVGQTVTLTSLAAGTCAGLRCRINGGRDLAGNGEPSAAMTAVQKFWVATDEGLMVLSAGEIDPLNFESSQTHGAVAAINQLIRRVSAQLFEVPFQLGATWVFDPTLFTIDATSGTKVLSAGDGGGSGVILASAAGKEFNVDTTGPYAASRASLRTNNTTGRLYSATGGPTGAQPFHMLIVGRLAQVAQGVNGYDGVAAFGAPGAAHQVALGVATYATPYSSGLLPAWQYDGPAPLLAAPAIDNIFEIQYDGTTLSFWLDGKQMATLDVTPTTLNITDASFGFQNWFVPSGTNPIADARIDAGFFKTNGIISRAQVEQWLRREFTDLGGTGFMVPCVGDSWTSGGAAGTTPAHYFPIALRNKSAGRVRIYPQNLGYSGQTAATILASKWLPHNDPATHLHVWWGINDFLNGNSAATVFNSTMVAVERAHERGLKSIVGTVFQPKTGALSAPQEAQRVAYTAMVLANAEGRHPYTPADYDSAMGPYDTNKFADHPTDLHASNATNDNILAPVGYAAILKSSGLA